MPQRCNHGSGQQQIVREKMAMECMLMVVFICAISSTNVFANVTPIDCYTCNSGNGQPCGSTTTTCELDQVCQNEVRDENGVFSVAKTCKAAQTCYDQANSNPPHCFPNNKDGIDSLCFYCCDTSLCNNSTYPDVTTVAPTTTLAPTTKATTQTPTQTPTTQATVRATTGAATQAPTTVSWQPTSKATTGAHTAQATTHSTTKAATQTPTTPTTTLAPTTKATAQTPTKTLTTLATTKATTQVSPTGITSRAAATAATQAPTTQTTSLASTVSGCSNSDWSAVNAYFVLSAKHRTIQSNESVEITESSERITCLTRCNRLSDCGFFAFDPITPRCSLGVGSYDPSKLEVRESSMVFRKTF